MPRSTRPERCPTWPSWSSSTSRPSWTAWISTAVEAKNSDPTSLGRQLAVVYEGAAALSASSNTTQPLPDARRAAETLIQAAQTGPNERGP